MWWKKSVIANLVYSIEFLKIAENIFLKQFVNSIR